MPRGNKALLLLVLPLALAGCIRTESGRISEQEYIEYVTGSESGLATVIKAGDWKYRFQYRPAGLIRLTDRKLAPQDSSNNDPKRYSNTVWFNVSLSSAAGTDDPLRYKTGSLNEYNRRLSYFLSAGPQYSLRYGSAGEMKQVGYQFENSFNLKPEVVSVVGFSIPDSIPKEKMQLVYTDGLFNTGIMKFEITKADLDRIPKI